MPSLGAATPFIGRTEELALLSDVVASVSAGHGRLAMIEGEAGIGKTRLLSEALQLAERSGANVFTASGDELARDRPFGPLIEALGLRPGATDPDRAEIGRIVGGEVAPQLSLGQVPELRFRALDAIVSLIERLSRDAPVVLAIEDLHWADPSTVLALHHVARHTTSLPVAVVATARPAPRIPEVDRLAGEAAERRTLVSLQPFDAEAVAELARATLREEVSPDLLAHLRGAGGNPFYLTELIGALQAEGTTIGLGALPPTLRLIILRRLSFLGEDTLDVLRIASVLGSTFALTDVSLVLDRPAASFTRPVREAIAAGVLGEAVERLAFRHDLVREAIYEDMPRAVRAGLHLQAGRALAAAGAPPVQVASQLALGASPGDGQAISWLRRAAQQAAPRAPTIAADLLRRALDLTAPEDPERDEVIAEYVWSLAWSGRPGDAESLAEEVLGRAHDASIGRVLRQALGVTLFLQGRTRDSLQQFETLLADQDLPPEHRAIALARVCLRRLFAGDFERAQSAAEEALEVGRDTGNDLAVCEALGVLCWVATSRGNYARGIELGRDAVAAASRNETNDGTYVQPRLYPQSRVYLGAALNDADLLDEAEGVLQEGRRLAEAQGADWSLPIFHAGLGLRRFLAGEWDDAVTEIETGLEIAEEIGTRNGIVFTWAMLAHIAIHRGELRQAEDLLRMSEEEIASSGPLQFRLHWALRARALFEEAQGNLIPAYSLLDSGFAILERIGMIGQYGEIGPDLVRLALAGGERSRAQAVTEAVESLAARAETHGARAAALRCRGMLKDDPDVLTIAVKALRATPRTVEMAFALEETGRALARAGRPEEAVRALEEAAAVYDKIGAQRLSARVDAALRESGVRRGKRGRRTPARVGWPALTPTEREVVRLAAEGLTNREIGERLFVSRRTVETHLSHVFGKLGISTRVQLAAEASRAGVGKADGLRRERL